MKLKQIFFVPITMAIFLLTSCLSGHSAEEKQTPNDVQQKEVKGSEYERSVANIVTDEVITEDTFKNDKASVIKIIEELDGIMRDSNYSAWLKYLTPNSISYWSQKGNLRAISAKLPIKNVTLKTLEDYFKFIFKPSRANKQIDEIRYISSNQIKAVQVDGQKDTVYYTFVKINNKWLVELDRLE